MWVRALKSFRGRYGDIKQGEKFNADPGYVTQLNKRKGNPLVEILDAQPEPGPKHDRSKGDAPGQAGKVNPGDQGQTPVSDTAQVPGDGQALTSQSLPVVPASRKKTVAPSPRGGRRGKPTPRKGKQKASTQGAPPVG